MKKLSRKGEDSKAEVVDMDGAKGTVIRHVITEKYGAPNFNMRVLSIEPGGLSPNHSHPWEHEFFILSGEGVGEVDNKEANVRQGVNLCATGCPALHPSNDNHGSDLTDSTNLIIHLYGVS